MKKALLILIIIPNLCLSQNFKELVKQYEKECSKIVSCTIKQYGEVSFNYLPVKNEKGKILHYVVNATDTIWKKPDCPKYKNPASMFYTGTINYDNITFTSTTSGGLVNTIKEIVDKIRVERDYVCDCKEREIEPFSKHFWNWLKERE